MDANNPRIQALIRSLAMIQPEDLQLARGIPTDIAYKQGLTCPGFLNGQPGQVGIIDLSLPKPQRVGFFPIPVPDAQMTGFIENAVSPTEFLKLRVTTGTISFLCDYGKPFTFMAAGRTTIVAVNDVFPDPIAPVPSVGFSGLGGFLCLDYPQEINPTLTRAISLLAGAGSLGVNIADFASSMVLQRAASDLVGSGGGALGSSVEMDQSFNAAAGEFYGSFFLNPGDSMQPWNIGPMCDQISVTVTAGPGGVFRLVFFLGV